MEVNMYIDILTLIALVFFLIISHTAIDLEKRNNTVKNELNRIESNKLVSPYKHIIGTALIIGFTGILLKDANLFVNVSFTSMGVFYLCLYAQQRVIRRKLIKRIHLEMRNLRSTKEWQ